ncbi:MAG: hypothetical protein ACKVK6_13390, partial [bacterium]
DAEASQAAERFFGDRSLPFKFTCCSERIEDCAAVCGGAGFGCDIASLQASEMGRPVYKKLGFVIASEIL